MRCLNFKFDAQTTVLIECLEMRLKIYLKKCQNSLYVDLYHKKIGALFKNKTPRI